MGEKYYTGDERGRLVDVLRKEEAEGRATKSPVANARQHGGEHYKSGYQHWDFVNDVGLDYYQGQASRYVTRWPNKGGALDLEKAIHYCDKAEELGRIYEMPLEGWEQALFGFCAANLLHSNEYWAIYHICRGSWDSARHAIRMILEDTPKQVAET
jgi:hypothetical protein